MNVVSLNNVSLDGNIIRKGASGGGGNVSLMTEVTWQELKDLRDNGQLTAGHKYRMIDYDTYTSQKDTESAMHPFDLILTALDNKTLSEECSAIHSARDVDGYFANSNLGAWKIWYCLDNGMARFSWAAEKGITCSPEPGFIFALGYFGDFEWNGETYTAYRFDYGKMADLVAPAYMYALYSNDVPNVGDIPTYVLLDGTALGEEGFIDQTADMGQWLVVSSVSEVEGKGVIYRLIDERQNDICYDFKNILISGDYTFYDYKGEVADYSLTSYVAKNTILPMVGMMVLPCIIIYRHNGGTNTIYGNVFSLCMNVRFELGDSTRFVCNEIRNCVDLLMERTGWLQGAEYSIYENLTGKIVQNNKIYNADIKGINGGDLDSITTKENVYTHIRQKADGTIYSYTDEDIYNAISATKTE